MTTLIIVLVIIAVAIAAAAFLARKKNRDANISRADQLRSQAATQAQSTIAPAQERAAAAEAEAEQARAVAARAEAEAEEARVAAQQLEATHEGQVRAADRLDPRVDHKADDYTPQVPGTADHTPTPPSEVNAAPTTEPTPEPTTEPTTATQRGDEGQPTLPRRTPGAQEMPGRPIERTDGGGGWFSKDTDKS